MNNYLPMIAAVTLPSLVAGVFLWTQLDGAPNQSRQTVSPLEIQTNPDHGHAADIDGQLSSVTRIPFRLTESNNISVQAVINGSDRLNLMFHTAVDSISLTSVAVEKIPSLKMVEPIEVQSWGGKSKADVSTGNRLQIENLEWHEQTIFVDELSGPGTDGKFGPHLFAGKILEINFDNRELVVHTTLPTIVTEVASTYQRLDFTTDHGSMFVAGEISVEGSTYINRFMVHSGFGGTILLDDAFVATHGLAIRLKTISERELKDAYGNVLKTKKVQLSSLDLGSVHFTDVPVEIFDGALGRQKISVLGGELLKRFNLIIDSANHHVYLAPSTLYGVEFKG